MICEPAALDCDVRAGPKSIKYIRQRPALFRICQCQVIRYLYFLQVVLDAFFSRYRRAVQAELRHRRAFSGHWPYDFAKRFRAQTAAH